MRWPNFPTAGSFVCDQSNIQIWMWWNCFAYARRFLESHLGLLFSFFLKWMNDSVHAMQAAWSPFGTSEPLITLPYVHLIIVQNVFRFFCVFFRWIAFNSKLPAFGDFSWSCVLYNFYIILIVRFSIFNFIKNTWTAL